jgi:hypothetical protein
MLMLKVFDLKGCDGNDIQQKLKCHCPQHAVFMDVLSDLVLSQTPFLLLKKFFFDGSLTDQQ